MTRYSVAFWKLVSDDTGNDAEIVQHEVEVDADNPGAAIASARDRFCLAEGIGEWTDRADEIRIRQVQPGRPAAIGQRELLRA